jgi:hypothetical protein
MPNLLNVLRTATDPGLRILRCKVMECAGLIGILLFQSKYRYPANSDIPQLSLLDEKHSKRMHLN